jgi:predicted double-glycine peptidase
MHADRHLFTVTARFRFAAAWFAAASLAGAAGAAVAGDVTMPTLSGGAYSVPVSSWREIPFRRVVQQQYDFSCGSAALATLLRYQYDRPVTEAQIFKAMYAAGDQAKIQKVGFSLLDMKRYLASQGFHANGYRVSLGEFEKLNSPGIALVKNGSYLHFVVIKGILGDRVLVGDPALGARTYSRDGFEKIWSGVVFVIDDPQNGLFNSQTEWAWHVVHVGDPYYLAEQSIGQLLRDEPTIYQIAAIRSGH